MAVRENPSTGVSSTSPGESTYVSSANYMPCHKCGEGALTYDADKGTSVCRSCGEPGVPEELR